MPRFRHASAVAVLLAAPLAALLAGLGTPSPLSAQDRPPGWALRLSLGRESLDGASRDTVSAPGVELEVGPGSRWDIALGLSRQAGSWEIGVEGSYAGGHLRFGNSSVTVDDLTTKVRRYRGALSLGRRLAGAGAATLLAEAGPVVDRWESSGIGNRTVIGARGTIRLRVPLGGVELENHAGFTLSPSPFDRTMVPAGVELRALRTWSLGAALRVGL